MTQLNIGVIGIGAFGSRVALRLLWSGYHTLAIYDVADVATRLFTNDYGGMALGSPKMMAQTCDAIIAVLPSAAELREVCFGWEGLAQGFAAGGILIDLGNTDPVETVNIAKELAAAGVDLVAAPAFGTPAQAKEGKLTLVVGGPEAAVARCRPVLEIIAAKILASRRRRSRPGRQRDRRLPARRTAPGGQRGDPARPALRFRAGHRARSRRPARRRRSRRHAAAGGGHPALRYRSCSSVSCGATSISRRALPSRPTPARP